MNAEKLKQETNDTKTMIQTILDGILKDINDTPNDTDLGRKIRAKNKSINKLIITVESDDTFCSCPIATTT